MYKIGDLVSINKDSYFNGAVQAEWFYDSSRIKDVATSFLFHGPKYYGVNSEDVKTNHSLCDTATFTKTIYDKIYNKPDSNRFMLTIAGYGAGKSHLSVTLASLLSGVNKEVQNTVLDNIKDCDKEIGEYISNYTDEKNLVLVLNGINDFNLNMEILRVAKKSLDMYGLDTDIFDDMTRAYTTARTYLSTSFIYLKDKYFEEAQNSLIFKKYSIEKLQDALNDNIEDYEAFSIVNKIYKSQTGNEISINDGVSASNVLEKLHEEYVVKNKVFKSIVILFDEFGRYLEFASNQPGIAGETGIQQIFEAVQNASPSILFVGFIQAELKAYSARVKNDNILRYIGRYDNSEKFYLSSNLETVLSSTVKKKNGSEKIIDNIFENSRRKFTSDIHNRIIRWMPETLNKSVWKNEDMFKKTIVKGSYPIHPLTVAALSYLSSGMQQRSIFTFLSEIFESYKDIEIDDRIEFIYPSSLIESSILYELINAEERTKIPGQNCTIYRDIVEKNEEILTSNDIKVLSSILIMNICKFKIYDKSDSLIAIKELSGLDYDSMEDIVHKMENILGIVYFDTAINRYMFMSEGNSKIDFNKLFSKKRLLIKKTDLLSSMPEEAKKELKIGTVEPTPFGRTNNIVTNEWSYNIELVDIKEFNSNMAENIKREVERKIHPDDSRAKVIYLYCNNESYDNYKNVVTYMKENNYGKLPIIPILIHDSNEIINDSLIKLRVLELFSTQERENFKKYYDKEKHNCVKDIIRQVSECARQKKFLTEDGIVISKSLLKVEVTNKFNELYKYVVPFTIDAFEKKIGGKARKYYISIIDALVNGKIEDIVEFESLAPDVKNRINSIFSVSSSKGWKVLYKNNVLGKPENPNALKIYEEIEAAIESRERISLGKLIDKYVSVPYGLNIYSASLLIIYVITLKKKNLLIYKRSIKSRLVDILTDLNDDKKDKLSELRNYFIEYTEVDEEEKISSIIEKVEKARSYSIDECEKLFNELNSIDARDVSNELRGRYISNKDILEKAVQKNNELEAKLKDLESKVLTMQDNPFLIKSILEDCSIFKEGEVESFSYRYSVNQIERAKSIRQESIEKFNSSIKNNAETFSLNDNKVFKNKVNNIGKLFEKLNKDGVFDESITLLNEANQIYSKRLDKSIKLMKIAKKMKEELVEIKAQVQYATNLDEATSKIEYWLNLKEEYIQNKVFKDLYNELNMHLDKVNEIESNSKAILDDIENLISSIRNLDDLIAAEGEIHIKSRQKLYQSVKDEVDEYYDEISIVLSELKAYKESKFSLNDIDNSNNNLKSKEFKKKAVLDCIDTLIIFLREENQKFNDEWKRRYNKSLEELKQLSIEGLNDLQKNSKKDYNYLSDENRELYNELYRNIQSILKERKIDNIVSIYKELDFEDKKKCISLLEKNLY